MNSENKWNYKSYRAKYERRVKAIYAFALVLLAAIFGVSFQLGRSWILSLTVTLLSLLFLLLIFLTQKNDDYYISNIIADLSELMDCLKELSGEEIFPSDEDSLLSKLQTQAISLAGILQKQSEKEEREHENIKALVSDLSHQLKTPIATLKMYSDFLKQDLSEKERDEYVTILRQAVERLAFLSEGMIKLSRLESGLIQIEKQKQSISDTVLAAIKDSYVRAKNKSIEIKYTDEFKGEVNHDSHWTAEAVFNLIDNAIKYGSPGNTISISIREIGSSVEIAVEDENELIDPKEYNSLFKRFYRGSNSKNTEGVGIGLYLTSDIIEKQGGFVSVKKGAKGNRFCIYLFKE